MRCMCHLCEQKCLQRVPKAVSDQIPPNVLEENSRQMDQHKNRLVFRTLIVIARCEQKSTRCRAEVTAPLDVRDGPAQLPQILRRHAVQGFVHCYTDLV